MTGKLCDPDLRNRVRVFKMEGAFQVLIGKERDTRDGDIEKVEGKSD